MVTYSRGLNLNIRFTYARTGAQSLEDHALHLLSVEQAHAVACLDDADRLSGKIGQLRICQHPANR